jgi:hypothetical protein
MLKRRFNTDAAGEDRDLTIDRTAGMTTVENHTLNGKAGRLNGGPSFIKRDAKTGVIVRESCYAEG